MATIASLLPTGEEKLRLAGVPDARREAASLLDLVLGRGRTFIFAHPEFELSSEQESRFFSVITRRASREPFHYIKGSKEFYGLEFEVSPAVLIPRPETEMLAERSIEFLSHIPDPVFCEIGVGSGCVSVAVLANVPRAKAVGLEISEPAAELAKRNAKRHGVDERIEIRLSDLFAALGPGEKFDLIVSNPPYVPQADIPHLQPEVKDHEPVAALTDGGDGLSIIRAMIESSPRHLRPCGELLLEIGAGQADAVQAMFAAELWSGVTAEPDLQGIHRVVAGVVRES